MNNDACQKICSKLGVKITNEENSKSRTETKKWTVLNWLRTVTFVPCVTKTAGWMEDMTTLFATLVRGHEYVCIMKKIKTTNIYWMLLVTWINRTTVNMEHRNLYHNKVTTVIVYSHSLAGCEKHLCYMLCHRMVNSRMVNFAPLHEEKVIKK